MSSLQSCITFTLALPLQAAPLGAFAPTVTVFPTSELLNNALCLVIITRLAQFLNFVTWQDFQHCYGASINPVQYAEMDNKKLRVNFVPTLCRTLMCSGNRAAVYLHPSLTMHMKNIWHPELTKT